MQNIVFKIKYVWKIFTMPQNTAFEVDCNTEKRRRVNRFSYLVYTLKIMKKIERKHYASNYRYNNKWGHN